MGTWARFYKWARLRWSQTDRTCLAGLKCRPRCSGTDSEAMFKWAVAVRSSACVTQQARCSGVCETAAAQGAVGSNASERSTLSL